MYFLQVQIKVHFKLSLLQGTGALKTDSFYNNYIDIGSIISPLSETELNNY